MNDVTTPIKIPSEIDDILSSQYQRVLAYKIRISQKLDIEDRVVMEKAVEDLFSGQLALANLESYLGNKIKTPQADIKSIARDIVGFRLYPALSYLKQQGQDIESYLKNSGGVKDEYIKNVETFKKAMTEERAGTYDNDSYLYIDEPERKITAASDDNTNEQIDEKDITVEDQKTALEDFFEEGLGSLLELDSGDIADEVNESLIIVLTNDESAKKDLAGKLLASKFTIGKEQIMLDDKPLAPVAANWLKDFFRVAGTQHFDTLSIAKYIISSANAKKLKEADQAKLRRFLTLYHNINFFPAPFAAIPVKDWQIIPNAEPLAASEPLSKKPPVDKPFSTPLKATPAPVIAKAPLKQAVSVDSPEVTELKNMMLKYPAGSLERAAIEEELKTLMNK